MKNTEAVYWLAIMLNNAKCATGYNDPDRESKAEALKTAIKELLK